MIHGDILNIEPSEIKFPFELKKEISCTVHLSNITESNVDFKVFSTNPKKYWVQPNNGVILPGSTYDIVVYMYEQHEAPLNMICTDMFMIRSNVASNSPKPGEVGPEMLTKESRLVFDHKLKVVYIPPHQQCSSLNISKTFTSRQSSTEEEHRSDNEITRAVSGIKDKLSETCVGKLLKIVPSHLKFTFELNKEMSCSLQLTNITKNHVAFKMKTTNPRQYSVRPNMGIVLPDATCDITVRMQAQKEAPPNMLCKDKFVLHSVVAIPGVTIVHMNPEMFKKSAGYDVEDHIFPVVFLVPSLSVVPPVEEHGGFLEASSTKHENSSGSEVIETLSSNQDDSLKKSVSFKDEEMSIGDLITVKPSELIFPFKLNKRVSCSLHLTNKTENHVAFKVRAKNPEKYTVQPSTGFISPKSKFDVAVTLLPQKRAPPDFQIQETFLLQCLGAASPGSTSKDAIRELFTKEAAYVKECKLRVACMPLAEPQLPFNVGSRESSADAGVLNQISEEFAESSSVAASGEQNEQSISPSEASEEKNEQTNVSEANVKPDDNGNPVSGWAIFCAVVVLLGVLYSSLKGNVMIKMLPVMMKTAMEMVSDMVGDWVVKALVVVCFQLIFGYQYMNNN